MKEEGMRRKPEPSRIAEKAASFTYRLAVETGRFVEIKTQIAKLSADSRIHALLIAF